MSLRIRDTLALDEALRLLNPWQRDFPLVREPFAVIAQALGWHTPDVLARLSALHDSGALSRIGGLFAAEAGGAALLAAMAVPPERLDTVAHLVSAHPGVNHNYERENRYNLWFVMTAPCTSSLQQAMQDIESATGLPALQLRMLQPYRIDLGFDLRHPVTDRPPMPVVSAPTPLSADALPLAALVETGLPLAERPFDVWAKTLGCSTESVLAMLQTWLQVGTLRRFGMVVRHHELGFEANAMTVFDVPDAQVDACGARLATYPGVTLAYRRERAMEWSYNLYCMVHGRHRTDVEQLVETMTVACGLTGLPRAMLFSRRRFKQVGARRFRPTQPASQQQMPMQPPSPAAPQATGSHHHAVTS